MQQGHLTPEYYSNKPIEFLLGKGICAEDLNDDSLGRALDILFEKGLSNLFAIISHVACHIFGVSTSAAHMDTTSFSMAGEYSEEEENAVHITYGHSKDKRPDLKQIVVGLISAYKTNIPLYFNNFDGNANDNKSFASMIKSFISQLKEGQNFPRVIADSAIYTEKILRSLPKSMVFLSRVPASLSQVKTIIASAKPKKMNASSDPRYRYQWHESNYGEVEQSWLLVHSQPAFVSAKKALDRRVEKEKKAIEKNLKTHAKKRFGCREDAKKSLDSLVKKLKYHKAQSLKIHEHKLYSKSGRPAKNSLPDKIEYSIQADLVREEEAIQRASEKLGFFMLATNQLEGDRPDADILLSDYKSQGTSIEKGFRFLKDPMFFADGLYLKKLPRKANHRRY